MLKEIIGNMEDGRITDRSVIRFTYSICTLFQISNFLM